DRVLVIHRIEGDHALDLAGRELEAPGHVVDDIRADPAILALAQMQHGQARGALGRVAGEKLVDDLLGFGRQRERHGEFSPRLDASTSCEARMRASRWSKDRAGSLTTSTPCGRTLGVP